MRRAVRVVHPTTQGAYFTYALVIELDGARWVPYCSRSTTDFSGEGGAGHRRVEAALRRLGIPVTSVPCPVEGDEAALLEKMCCNDAMDA